MAKGNENNSSYEDIGTIVVKGFVTVGQDKIYLFSE
jgi:hypothetical protein